ncbi:MAG TPA: site-specific integrase [Rubrobacter sp.]|nr:site-specific integrase [Rubrobacter sp.]
MSEPSAPYPHGHSLRSARRRRTGNDPCWQEAWGEPQSVCSGSCSLFRSSLYLSRAVYLLPGQRYSISWPYKAALNFPKPTRCPPWSSSIAADPRGGKTDRNARRRKSPQGRGNLTYRSFRPLLKRTNLPRIRFHDLRHTCATLLLSNGTHPKIVQEMLGHANISMTMDTYSHVLPDMQEKAVSAMDDALS